jgi:hypothetical protein
VTSRLGTGKSLNFFFAAYCIVQQICKKSPDTVSLNGESRRTRTAKRRKRRRGQDMLDRTISRPSWTGSMSEWTLPLFSIFLTLWQRESPPPPFKNSETKEKRASHWKKKAPQNSISCLVFVSADRSWWRGEGCGGNYQKNNNFFLYAS